MLHAFNLLISNQLSDKIAVDMSTSESSSADTISKLERREIPSDPFNRSDADVLFRTCDGIVLRLHSPILTIASPVLGKMSEETLLIGNEEPGLPRIVDVAETCKVLDSLFRYCYPIVNPKLETLEDIRDVLTAATRYAVKAAIDPLKEDLLKYVNTEPVRVYAIACINGLESIARHAANLATADISFLKRDFPELSLISAEVYWNLVVYYRSSQKYLRWKSTCSCWWEVTYANPPTEISKASKPFDATNADVILQTNDGVQFRVHKSILSMSSEFFEQMFALPQGESEGSAIQIVHVSESSSTMDYLLKLAYPNRQKQKLPMSDLGLLFEVLAAAVKYDMFGLNFLLEDQITLRIQYSPINVFLIACQYGLKNLATEAARQTLRCPILQRSTVGEDFIFPQIRVPAKVVYALVRYGEEYTNIVNRAFVDSSWTALCITAPNRARMKTGLEGNQCKACLSRQTISPVPEWNVPAWLEKFLLDTKEAMKKGAPLGNGSEDTALDEALSSIHGCKPSTTSTHHYARSPSTCHQPKLPSTCREVLPQTLEGLRECRKRIVRQVEDEISKVRVSAYFIVTEALTTDSDCNRHNHIGWILVKFGLKLRESGSEDQVA